MATNPIALQMYTLREDAQQDFIGTLRKVAALGYGAVELAGMGGMTAEQLRPALDELGLKVSGAHIALNRLEGELDAVIAEMKTLGGRYVICPFLPPDRRPDGAGYRTLAQTLSEIGRTVQQHGLQMAYHNHDFELQRFDGATGLEIMRDNSDPALLAFELDMYWVAYAGMDPLAVLKSFAGRVPLVHLKDMKAGNRVFAEVGSGTLDIPAIIATAEQAGAEWFIVEQDRCERPALESVKMSIEYLRSIGRA